MNKISVVIKKDTVIFSLYTKNIDNDNLNNTNIIDTQNLNFSENYILDNFELIASFFNLIILKNNVNIAIIKNLDIGETILNLIKELNNINKVIFKEDKELNYTLSNILLNNPNLVKIECYSMPEIMFNRFPKDIVDTRCEILFTSDFMRYNNINTYSKLCNKDKVVIDGYLTKYDVDDITYFFKNNKNLKKVFIRGYKKDNLIAFLEMVHNNNLKKISIILIEDINVTNNLIKDSKLFLKLSKKYNVNIKIKYSKSYKEKNRVKELNINIFKTILLIIIILNIILVFMFKRKEIKDSENTKVNLEIIDKITESVDGTLEPNLENNSQDLSEEKNSYKSPYYTKYEDIYSKLYEINNDTVGWLKVNNTKIDYPVVQAKDNNYYLDHSFDKSKNGAGWVFVDYRNNMDNINDNTIIYAHNVEKNSLMFGSLKNVLSENWNSNNDNLLLSFNIKGKKYTWRIFSIYVIENTNDYLITTFNSRESYLNYINKVVSRSIKKFNVDISTDDKILTLSTCHKDSNHRLVVHAKKVS